MQRSPDFRVPGPAAEDHGAGRPPVAPPSGSQAVKARLRAGSDRSSPESPDR